MDSAMVSISLSDSMVRSGEHFSLSGNLSLRVMVYLLTMQFTTSWDSGCITELYADYDMARFAMLKGIREEQAEGCVKDWAERDALEEECCTDFYEAWHRDKYSEKHFTASIEKLSLTLPQRIIEAE